VMRDPIDVIRHGQNVWTGWHKNQASNRVDVWTLEKDGKLSLFQAGIVTHDNGQTFVLHGEYRWKGQLFAKGDGVVAKPEHPKWGSFNGGTSNRNQIFSNSEMLELVYSANSLQEWSGNDTELDPPLPEVPNGLAVIQWYVFFAGQTGQGIAIDQSGNTAWVHGKDVEGFDPSSPELPLWRGDIISFTEAVENWGAKKSGPPKLTGVKLVKRDW